MVTLLPGTTRSHRYLRGGGQRLVSQQQGALARGLKRNVLLTGRSRAAGDGASLREARRPETPAAAASGSPRRRSGRAG